MAKSSGWQVTSQVTDQVINTNAGQTVTGTYVYFLTGDGNAGSVFVPDEHYTATKIHDMIEARASALDEVGKLTLNRGQG